MLALLGRRLAAAAAVPPRGARSVSVSRAAADLREFLDAPDAAGAQASFGAARGRARGARGACGVGAGLRARGPPRCGCRPARPAPPAPLAAAAAAQAAPGWRTSCG